MLGPNEISIWDATLADYTAPEEQKELTAEALVGAFWGVSELWIKYHIDMVEVDGWAHVGWGLENKELLADFINAGHLAR